MCASPWCTIRFSPRFLNVFFRFPPAPSFFSGVAPSGAASAFAILCLFFLFSRDSDRFLLRDRALARTLAGAGIRARALAANRQATAVPHAAVTADFHQPLDVHGDVLAQIA